MLLILFISFFSFAYGQNQHVIHGEVAPEDAFPWQGSLMRGAYPFGYHTCGCVLISNYYALTAAHCTVGSDANQMWARFGANNYETATDYVAVEFESITEHPLYVETACDGSVVCYPNDISVLKFISPVAEGTSTGYIPLTNDLDYDPNDCYISGWGKTDATVNEYPDDLMQAEVFRMEDTQCAIMAGPGFNSQYHVCVYDDDTVSDGGRAAACSGDSGGPFHCVDPSSSEYVLVGITSWIFYRDDGYLCDHNLPSVYTDVYMYRDWVCGQTGVC